MKVAALTGSSGSGKTTLIVQLIAQHVARGLRVGAIKHTHHTLNEEHRGDTARFRDAGAEPVILAGRGEAVLFASAGASRIAFEQPRELLRHFDCDVVFVEGFAGVDAWPRVTISAAARPTLAEVMANLDRIWRFT
jgi:molybdopterin-guanine dinucleotide biosynthesis adapter protein